LTKIILAELITTGRKASTKEIHHRITGCLEALHPDLVVDKPTFVSPVITFNIHELHAVRPNIRLYGEELPKCPATVTSASAIEHTTENMESLKPKEVIPEHLQEEPVVFFGIHVAEGRTPWMHNYP